MFKTMTTLLNKKTPEKSDIEKISSFVMVKWLSNNKTTVIPANIINLNYQLPIYNQYRFLDDYFELTGIKQKISSIRYNKEKKEILEETVLGNIKKYYQVNQQIAKKYYQLMDDTEKKKFSEMYKEGKI